MNKKIISLILLSVLYSSYLIIATIGFALTGLTVECEASLTDDGKTVVTVVGSPTDLSILVSASSIDIADAGMVAGGARPFTSGDSVFARTGDYIHIWQSTNVDAIVVTAYGEEAVEIDEIKPVNTLTINLANDGEVGKTRVTPTGYTGKPRILINRVSMSWDTVTPFYTGGNFELPSGSKILGDGTESATAEESVNVGDYIHIWTGAPDLTSLTSYSEQQVTAGDIALLTDPINVTVDSDRIFGDNITLEFTDGLSDYYYFYYIIQDGSNLGYPVPTTAAEAMVNSRAVVNQEGVPLDDTFSHGYFQTEHMTNTVYGIVTPEIPHVTLKPSTNYTLYVVLSKSGASVANQNFYTTTFTTNAIEDASGLETYFQFVDDDGSDNETSFQQLKEIPASHKFAYKSNIDHPGAPKKGEILTDWGIWTIIEDGQTFPAVHEYDIGVAQINNNNQVVKFAVKETVVEVEIAPPLSGGLSFEDDVDSIDKTVAVVDDLTGTDGYMYKEFTDPNDLPVLKANEILSGPGWLPLPANRKIEVDHNNYIVVVKVNTDNFIIQVSQAQAVVLIIPALKNGLTFIDDDADNSSTKIQIGQPSVPGNTFAYKVSTDSKPVEPPSVDDELIGWSAIENGQSISTVNGKHIGVAEVRLAEGKYYAVQFTDATALVEDDPLPVLCNGLSFVDDTRNNDETIMTLTGTIDDKILFYRTYEGSDTGMSAPAHGEFITGEESTWKNVASLTMSLTVADGTRIGVAELQFSDGRFYFKKYSEGTAVVQVSPTPELVNGLSFTPIGTSTTTTTLVLGDKSDSNNSYVYKKSIDSNPVGRPNIDEALGDWAPVNNGDPITVTSGQYIGVAEVGADNMAVQFSSKQAVVYVYVPPEDNGSSQSNDRPSSTPTTPDPPEEEEPVIPPTNEELEAVGQSLEQVETPEEAEKGLDTIGETLAQIDPKKLEGDGEEKKELLDHINKLIDSAGSIMDKLDEDADRGKVAEQIIENTKEIVKQMAEAEEFSQGHKERVELSNKLVELANKAIEEESKLVVHGGADLIMPDSVAGSLEDSKALKEKLEKTLNEAGIDQSLKSVKQSLVVRVDESEKKRKVIGFHRSALEQLAEAVDEVVLDFGGTEINIDKKDLENAKENLFFTKEDSQGNQQGDGQETVREINAYKGSEKVEKFEKPVKVTLSVDDFGFGDATPEELNALIVMVQNEETGTWEPNGGVYDPVTRTIALYRIHMSKYTVVKNKKKFSDVDNSEVKETINSMLGKGIVNASDSFKPDESISREEFASWICRAYGLKAVEEQTTFADVDESNPYCNDIANAAKHGLVFGRSETEFDPKEKITREEMATLVARAVSNYNDTKVPDDGAKRFASLENNEDISSWAVDNVAMAIDMGIMDTDDNGDFNPSEFITKEQAAEVFSKVYK